VDYRLRALWGLFSDCLTSGRFGAALAVARKIFQLARRNRPILLTGQSPTVWLAHRCLAWVTLMERGGGSSACWVAMSPGDRTSSGFNVISG